MRATLNIQMDLVIRRNISCGSSVLGSSITTAHNLPWTFAILINSAHACVHTTQHVDCKQVISLNVSFQFLIVGQQIGWWTWEFTVFCDIPSRGVIAVCDVTISSYAVTPPSHLINWEGGKQMECWGQPRVYADFKEEHWWHRRNIKLSVKWHQMTSRQRFYLKMPPTWTHWRNSQCSFTITSAVSALNSIWRIISLILTDISRIYQLTDAQMRTETIWANGRLLTMWMLWSWILSSKISVNVFNGHLDLRCSVEDRLDTWEQSFSVKVSATRGNQSRNVDIAIEATVPLDQIHPM